VNINYAWVTDQLEYIVRDCGIRALFTDGRKLASIMKSSVLADLGQVIVRGARDGGGQVVIWEDLPEANDLPPCPSIDTDLAALLYTSGSTGKPKGVMFTHQNIVMGARIVAKYLGNTCGDRILSLLPLSFDYGLNQIMTMFLVGGSVVLQPVSLPAEIIKTVVQHQVTGVALVAPSWTQVVQYLHDVPTTFPALRYITNSGGKIPRNALALMPGLFPGVEIFLMYGLTEAFRSTYLPPCLFEAKMGSIGRAIPNTEIYVVHPEDGVCGPGQQGELIHRGSLITLGYWNNPEATNEKLRVNPHLMPLIGEEKVLHSGDTVRVDEDGFLWFVGRADSMIKCSGFRLSPTEVEDLLCGFEGVADAVAYGVDDDALGQVVHAVIALHADAPIEGSALKRYCMQKMANYMVPRAVRVHPGTMPRTGNGKIDRQAVISSVTESLTTHPSII
jgi:acyl-CoA synthetase (AMP-forming)/AMP-acid ligase II